MVLPALKTRNIVGIRTDSTSYTDAALRVITWALAGESRYVCVANVHMTMESYDSAEYRDVVNGADLVTPDGMPLVWALHLFDVKDATRVAGFPLTLSILGRAEANGVRVGFYGAKEDTLAAVKAECWRRFPDLHVVYMKAPPFRTLTVTEDSDVVRAINDAGVQILFVGLGCPKQECWMASHRGRLSAVMLGVGATFDFLARNKPQAPMWMQSAGLEWLFRLASEPRRLIRRYAYHNPRFIVLLAGQYLRYLMA